ncbi:hypothetical protein ACUXV3_03205 [Roseobacteraceae bacterium NS-SX3]
MSHQTVRARAKKLGQEFAKRIRRLSAGKLGGKLHLHEVAVLTGGRKHWCWRAVNQERFVLDVLVQARRATGRPHRRVTTRYGKSPRVFPLSIALDAIKAASLDKGLLQLEAALDMIGVIERQRWRRRLTDKAAPAPRRPHGA